MAVAVAAFAGVEGVESSETIYGYLDRVDPTTDEVIEVAGGPSLFSMMAMAAHRRRPFGRVVFTDLGPENLDEVRRWLDDRPNQFDHGELLRWLAQETGAPPEQVAAALRESPWELVPVDLSQGPPRGVGRRLRRRLLSLLRRVGHQRRGRVHRADGKAAEARSTRSRGAHVLHLRLRELHRRGPPVPGLPVDEHSISSYLERAELQLEDIAVSTVAAEQPEASPGYHGLLFVGGRLPATGRAGASDSRPAGPFAVAKDPCFYDRRIPRTSAPQSSASATDDTRQTGARAYSWLPRGPRRLPARSRRMRTRSPSKAITLAVTSPLYGGKP